jgi:hypothetical protein
MRALSHSRRAVYIGDKSADILSRQDADATAGSGTTPLPGQSFSLNDDAERNSAATDPDDGFFSRARTFNDAALHQWMSRARRE